MHKGNIFIVIPSMGELIFLSILNMPFALVFFLFIIFIVGAPVYILWKIKERRYKKETEKANAQTKEFSQKLQDKFKQIEEVAKLGNIIELKEQVLILSTLEEEIAANKNLNPISKQIYLEQVSHLRRLISLKIGNR